MLYFVAAGDSMSFDVALVKNAWFLTVWFNCAEQPVCFVVPGFVAMFFLIQHGLLRIHFFPKQRLQFTWFHPPYGKKERDFLASFVGH